VVVIVALYSCADARVAAAQNLLRYRIETRIDGTRDTLLPLADVSIGPRGEIAFIQSQDRRILIYDTTGRRIRVIGRAGEGPGEFQFLSKLGWLGDSLWAWDAGQARLTIFSMTGQVGRVSTLDGPAGSRVISSDSLQGLSSLNFYALYSNGSSLRNARVDARTRAPRRFCWGSPCLVMVDATDTLVSVVANLPADSSAVNFVEQGGDQLRAFSTAIPFHHMTRHDVSADGAVIGLVTTSGIPRAESGFRVVLLSSAGDTVFSRMFQVAGVPVERREVDSAIAATVERLRARRWPSQLSRMFEESAPRRIPRYHQPYRFFKVTMDHSVWVQMRPENRTSTWLGLDSTGAEIGRLVLPDRMTLLECDGSKAWVMEVDDDGVPSILRLSITGRRP
jgi:hypothetical protein